jgi:hypothetical protein
MKTNIIEQEPQLTIIRNFRAHLPQYKAPLRHIINNIKCRQLPTSAAIVGMPGTGKTEFGRDVENNLQTNVDDLHKSVHLFTLPSPLDIKSICRRMLDKLGTNVKTNANSSYLTSATIAILKEKSSLVLLDNLNGVLCLNSSARYILLDWIYYLITETRLPYILMLTPRIESLLQFSENLNQRISTRFYINPFSKKEFMETLESYKAIFPSSFHFELTNQSTRRQLYSVTRGVIAELDMVLKIAAFMATCDGFRRSLTGYLQQIIIDHAQVLNTEQ